MVTSDQELCEDRRQEAQTVINLRKPETIIVRLIDDVKIIIVNVLTGSLGGVSDDHLIMRSFGGILPRSNWKMDDMSSMARR
jgi:hypothetical protein